ncbi:MAG TPA: IPT/TIG domain-containing protein [Polyangiaceae bacterium]|jgi:hypothetical protein
MRIFALALVLLQCSSTPVANDAGVDAAPDAASCAAPDISCGGKCVDTKTDVANCGKCGLTCSTGENCCGASCSSDPQCSVTVTSLSSTQGYLNGGDYVTLHGSGFAAGMRAWVGDGRSPVRVIDAQTALLVTPPAPIGKYDVRVQVGAISATLPLGYEVHTESFGTQWAEISMSTPRGNFPAMTTLQDGRALVVGGTSTSDPSSSLATADLYDPVAKQMSPAAGAMSEPRNTVSAITLLDGRALVVGACNITTGTGCLAPGDRAVADLFDPKTNTFATAKTTLADATRVYMRLTMLSDGRILVTSNGSPTSEIFDPTTDSFSSGPASNYGAFGFPSRLRDGRVIFVSATSEIYDADANTVTPLPAAIPHGVVAAFTLPDGRVISPGGADDVNDMITPTDVVSLVDAAQPAVTTLAQKLSSPRLKFASALLGDGTVMVAAGVAAPYPATYGCQSDTFPTTNAVDVVDPKAGTVAPLPALNDDNMELVATTLLDGSILIGGGAACGGAGAYPYVYFLKSVPGPN